MVFAWARKEVINLTWLLHSDINVPRPLKLKNNVLVLEFLGKDGTASPRLGEHVFAADLEESQKLYYEWLYNMMVPYNISMFFKKSKPSLKAMALQEAFDFIIRLESKPNLMPKQLQVLLNRIVDQSKSDFTTDDLENEVFKNSDVKSNLYEMNDQRIEDEIEKYMCGAESLFSR